MLFEDQLQGQPGGPQPPQPGSPAPSAPPGTPPAAPAVDLGAPAPIQPPSGDLSTTEPAPAQAGVGEVRVADAQSDLEGSLQGQPRTDLDQTLRMLEDSLKPRAQTGVPRVPLLPGMPGVQVDETQPGGLPEDPEEPEVLKNSPSLFTRAVYRAFGWDVEDPMPGSRFATSITGMLGGAQVGASIPGPPLVKGFGGLVGGTVGTVLGAMAPENTLDALEMIGVLEPGSRDRLGLNDQDLKTVLLGEAALDLWFAGGVAAARGMSRGVSNFMTGANATSKGMAEAASREGIALLPVQVGEGRFARAYVSVLGRLPLVGTPIKKGSDRAMQQIGRMFEGIPERLGPLSTTDEVSGHILREARYTVDGISQMYERRAGELMRQADMMKVVVRPVQTRATTDSLLRRTQAEIPKGFGGRPAEALDGTKDLRQFLARNTKLLTDTNPTTGLSGTEIADLPLRQMDTFVKQIDRKIAKWAQANDSITVGRYQQLRASVVADSVTGMVPAGRNAAGRQTLRSTAQSDALMAEFRQMDDDLTTTVHALFSTTTAERMGIRTSITGRAVQMHQMGPRGYDKLGETILRGDNPLAVEELARLVSPATMRRLGNSVFNTALEEAHVATQAGQRMFDPQRFADALGVNRPTSAKFQQTQALLNATGGITMPQLRQFIDFSSRAAGAEIPNASQFLARKVALGGFSGVMVGGGMLTAGPGGGLVAGLSMVGGLRLVSAVISNPRSARALTRVFDEEASMVVRRAAWYRAATFGVYDLVEGGHIDAKQADNLLHNLGEYAGALTKAFQRTGP